MSGKTVASELQASWPRSPRAQVFIRHEIDALVLNHKGTRLRCKFAPSSPSQAAVFQPAMLFPKLLIHNDPVTNLQCTSKNASIVVGFAATAS